MNIHTVTTASGSVYVLHSDRTITRIADEPILDLTDRVVARPFAIDRPIVVGERFTYRLTDTNEPVHATAVVRIADADGQPLDRLDLADLGFSDPLVLRNLRRGAVRS